MKTALLIAIALVFAACDRPYLLEEYLNGTGSLTISPVNPTVSTQGETVFSASGGVPPYTYSVWSGVGAIHPDTGVYASSTAGSATILAVDATETHYGLVDVEVMSTGATGLWLSPLTMVMDVGETAVYRAGGGTPPYMIDLVFGDGSFDTGTDTYTASLSPGYGYARIEVTDDGGLGDSISAVIAINNPAEAFEVVPKVAVVHQGESLTFTATGGTPMIVWTLSSGNISSVPPMVSGSVTEYTPDPAEGLGSQGGAVRITARDADNLGNSVHRGVIVLPP